MLAEITAGLGSLKAAADLLQGLNAVATQAAINDVKIPLQGHIFEARQALSAAQDAQSAALERIRQLEKKIVEFENWDREKQRYELQKLDRGFVAYVLKLPERASTTAHAICTNCYERSFKSILQSNGKVAINDHAWFCPSCKTAFPCQTGDMGRIFSRIDAAT